MHDSTRTLHTGLFDYAGLFPPAQLSMAEAVAQYAQYVSHPCSFMLGRFVLQSTQLQSFEDVAGEYLPDAEEHAWRLSGLVGAPGPDLDDKVESIFNFNAAHETRDVPGAVVCDAIEAKAGTADDVDAIMHLVPEQLSVAIEVDHRTDVRGMIAAIAGTGATAKIRCGGVTPDLIPTTREIADFIAACGAAGVAFKATAGLHHPIRKERPLTYEADAPRGVMHGFLNVFVAAVMAHAHRLSSDELLPILEATNDNAFIFTEGGLTFQDTFADNAQVARARESFAIGIGSCSFTEPVEDLVELGILEKQTA